MWWPSFLSVLNDLWLFCTGRTPKEAPATTVPGPGPLLKREVQPPARLQQVKLRPGVSYGEASLDTVMIRNRLSAYDSHITTKGALTEYEWLLYTLQDKRLEIPLVALRLTPLGRWHTTLKGQPGVLIGVTPYTSALMEWQDGESDKVALVEEVAPDETLVIGELGSNTPGLYETTKLTKAQWLELRPVFTSFI